MNANNDAKLLPYTTSRDRSNELSSDPFSLFKIWGLLSLLKEGERYGVKKATK